MIHIISIGLEDRWESIQFIERGRSFGSLSESSEKEYSLVVGIGLTVVYYITGTRFLLVGILTYV